MRQESRREKIVEKKETWMVFIKAVNKWTIKKPNSQKKPDKRNQDTYASSQWTD